MRILREEYLDVISSRRSLRMIKLEFLAKFSKRYPEVSMANSEGAHRIQRGEY